MRKYMVIEKFRPGCMDKVYARFEAEGRMLPDGLVYLDSWLSREQEVCYQLMETADPALFEPWMRAWDDLVDFKIVPLDT